MGIEIHRYCSPAPVRMATNMQRLTRQLQHHMYRLTHGFSFNTGYTQGCSIKCLPASGAIINRWEDIRHISPMKPKVNHFVATEIPITTQDFLGQRIFITTCTLQRMKESISVLPRTSCCKIVDSEMEDLQEPKVCWLGFSCLSEKHGSTMSYSWTEILEHVHVNVASLASLLKNRPRTWRLVLEPV